MSRAETCADDWMLQRDEINEMPQETRQKVAEGMVDSGWAAVIIQIAIKAEEEHLLSSQYIEWAQRTGKIVEGDEIKPYYFINCEGVAKHGVAVWRRTHDTAEGAPW